MHAWFDSLLTASRAVRPGRLLVLLLVALLAGLACDWLRPEQRLVFSQPLPAFNTTLPPR